MSNLKDCGGATGLRGMQKQAIMQRHIDGLRAATIARTMLKVGDQAPPIVLKNAKGATVDVGVLIKTGPVIVTFYRGGWCPYCNLELKAYQEILPEIAAAGASLVAISPEKPDDTLSTVEKNALRFEVLSDLGQKVGRPFGLVYEFTEELKQAYHGFNLDIPARNGTPGEWALPVSATYVIDRCSCRGRQQTGRGLARTAATWCVSGNVSKRARIHGRCG